MSRSVAFLTLFLSALLLVAWPLIGDESVRAQSIPQQWQASPHAGSMDAPAERDRMNSPGCARCHTAQGYQHEVLGGLESAAPYPEALGLTCVSCHMEGDGAGRMGPLRAETTRDACRGCHDELVTNQPDDLSWCSQWGIFEGEGGAGGTEGTPVISTHTRIENGCVACHMAPAGDGVDPSLVGGHTFRVKTKGDLPPAFNSGPCLSCHKLMTVDDLTRSQDQVQELLSGLGGLLPQRPDPETPGGTVPRFPADPSLTEVEARGSYNYWLVEKDGSLGVHNPDYTRELIEKTIEELKGREGPVLPEPELGTQIDHVIWAVPDLDRGVDLFKEMSGVTPVVGGVHPGRGTRNSLVSAGENTYVEIIAPDPGQMPLDPETTPVQAFAHQISTMSGPEVDMFAFSAPDLEAIKEKAKGLGLEVVGPSPGQRMTPEGVLIRWSHVDFIGHDFGQFLPFALDWLDSPHPSTTSPKGALIEGITVEHPQAEELGRLYEGLGIPAEVVEAEKPRIVVRMRSELGAFELTSGVRIPAKLTTQSGAC